MSKIVALHPTFCTITFDWSHCIEENEFKAEVNTKGGCCLVAELCLTLLWPLRLGSARLFGPWDYPGKNTGVGCHFLLQGIFLTQGSDPCLLPYHLSPLGSHRPISTPSSFSMYFCNCSSCWSSDQRSCLLNTIKRAHYTIFNFFELW